MKTRIVAALTGLLLFAAVPAASWAADKKAAEKPSVDPTAPKQVPYTKEELDAAIKATKAFIEEVDKEDGQTWAQFSELAKKQTPEAQWKVGITTIKSICGAVVNRANLRGGCFDGLPDTPPGRYFIMDMDSKFERLSMNERVVLVQEDGQWKIAGYFRTKRN